MAAGAAAADDDADDDDDDDDTEDTSFVEPLLNITYRNPGSASWIPLPSEDIKRLPNLSLNLTVPLVRGAAVVRIARG